MARFRVIVALSLLAGTALSSFGVAEEQKDSASSEIKPSRPTLTPRISSPAPPEKVTSETLPAPAPAERPSPEMIRKWIVQLGANRFEGREEATRLLTAAGVAAVEPLTQAALQTENLELTIRAIRVLQAIYSSGDDAAFVATETALETIVTSPHPHAARRAVDALRSRAAVRQDRAIAKIRELGGSVDLVQFPNDVARGANGEPLVQKVTLLRGWKGGDAGLREIRRLSLPPYQTVQLYIITGAQVSEEALDELSKEFPQLKLEHRGSAMLGVSMSPTPEECQIIFVTEDSAAEKAGLKSGDYIVAYDGQPVRRSQDIIDYTKTKNAGDKVTLEIVRASIEDGTPKRLTKVVTLGEWK